MQTHARLHRRATLPVRGGPWEEPGLGEATGPEHRAGLYTRMLRPPNDRSRFGNLGGVRLRGLDMQHVDDLNIAKSGLHPLSMQATGYDYIRVWIV